MENINCPYCNEPDEINHDDGYGYEENVMHEQHCSNCDKEYGFTTEISFYYAEFSGWQNSQSGKMG